LKNVRTEYSSLDDERHVCAARQDKERSRESHQFVDEALKLDFRLFSVA
jgi:hypothetical protein